VDGELAQVVALVAHGNAALVGTADLSDLEASNSTFQYVRSVTFEVPARRRTRAVSSAVEWLDAASRWKIGRFSLVGGGGRRPRGFANEGDWGVLGHAPDRVCAWYGSWVVNSEGVDPANLKPRIWEVSYRVSAREGRIEPAPVDLDTRRTELVEAITEARDFAGVDPHLQTFIAWFEEALAMASNPGPVPPYHPDMMPVEGYPTEARQLLSMATRSHVFGGMGSWNDIGFADQDTKARYEATSERLYRAVADAVRDATNAFERR
jgi:hypothetical protein